MVVEDGVLEWDRQHLLGPEPDRVVEELRIVDADDVERADADPVVGDAEPNALARQVVALEELAQRVRECAGVAQLAADDDAVLERR